MDFVKLKEDLKRDEGYKTHAYRDTNGFYTIGVGHLVGETPRILDLTDDEIDALLERDIHNAITALCTVFGIEAVVLNYGSPRVRGLVNMAFNRGLAHMQQSTTITPAIKTAFQTEDWEPVRWAIKNSPWAQQIGARAGRLATMIADNKEPA